MGTTYSCSKHNADIIPQHSEVIADEEESNEEKKNEKSPVEASNVVVADPTTLTTSVSETIFGSDSEGDDENLRGVSNVVYRKDFVQTVYSFTSDQLGIGITGPIRTVINRKTGGRFAMKTINLLGYNFQQKERLKQEILILGRLHHPNIVKLFEVFETPNAMYLIMELLSGGELYSKLIHSAQGRFSEEYSKRIIRDVLNAIAYLHETKNIAHRDLKLGNIMFSNTSADAEIKLIDFGLSKVMYDNKHNCEFVSGSDYMHSLVGTRYYIAPEVYCDDYKGMGYNKSCDMWSIGIITYFLLTGHNPLPPSLANLPFDQIKVDSVPFPKAFWSDLSDESKSFVQKLLVVDPVKRMTVIEAQNHPWMRKTTPHNTYNIPSSIITAMQEFQNYNRLRKAALTAVAYHLNSNDLLRLSDIFEFFDKQDDGSISFEEFRDALMALRDKETFSNNQDFFTLTTDESKLRELFNNLDFDNGGTINYSEFLAACLARKEGLRREYAELIFKLIDRSHEGSIRIEDLHLFFGEEISVDEIKACILESFGEMKNRLTESDLECILNTKMITNNRAEDLVIKNELYADEDETYATATSLFNRVATPVQMETVNEIEENDSISEQIPVVDKDELSRRCKALASIDKISSIRSGANVSSIDNRII